MKEINPNLIKLAEQTYNPDLKLDKTILDKKPNIEPSTVPNLTSYIYVPPIDLYVAKGKTLHGKNWYEAHKELHKQGLQMLTIPEFIEFIKYLKRNPTKDSEKILDEILTARKPWRGEWLDADFKFIDDKLHINYNYRTINGELKPLNSEPLEDCLMENKEPGIDLEYWLNNPTKQGLPRKDTPGGKLYYWCPVKDNDSVGGFYANSDGAELHYNWSSDGHPSVLVRATKTRELK